MIFNYYYGSQADQFSFIRIPKVMLTKPLFAGLSMQAKVLYGVLLDRMTLSRKNGWFDEENRVFIIYQIGEIQEDLGFSKKKAIDLLTELEKFGLLEKKRRGHGLPNILYVKSFMTGLDAVGVNTRMFSHDRSDDCGTSGVENADSRSADLGTSRGTDSGTSKVLNLTPQEVSFSAPLKNKTDMSNTDWSNISSDRIISAGSDEMRSDSMSISNREQNDVPVPDAKAYEQMIHENIGYDDLLIAHPYDGEMIEGIAALILETVLTQNETIVIASNRYPAEVVKSKFLKLGYSHIEYVLFCLQRNTTKVNNIKKYLLAALFNAPSTINGYYRAEVNHDMYGSATQ